MEHWLTQEASKGKNDDKDLSLKRHSLHDGWFKQEVIDGSVEYFS